MRRGGVAVGALLLFTQTVPAYAQAQTYTFDIPAQDLGPALRAFAQASRQQVTFDDRAVQGKGAPALKGTYTARAALDRLLEGSGLSVKTGRSGLFIVAPTVSQVAGVTSAGADPDNPNDIIVTATKRAERVRDISGSVTAFDEKSLETLGASSFADYLTRTPGVVFNQSIPGNSSAIIRGVATTTGIAQAQGTTGYFIDDVPLTDPFYSSGIPDIDTFDVDNIVVLRGPQGTLFGSSSMGGAINYQAARPNLTTVEAHVRGGDEGVSHGGNGYNFNGMINVPIVDDVLAVRAVYGHRRIAGFIDNVGTGEDDSNRTTIDGGRVLVTLKPASGTTINYLFLEQYERTDDGGSEMPAVGSYEKSTFIPEPYKYRTTIHNLRLDQDLGFATLTATATYHSKIFSSQQDFSGLEPALAPVTALEPGTSRGNTFEVRLASPSGHRFEYLIGAFDDLTHERVINSVEAPAAVPVIGTSSLFDALFKIRGHESAIFGEGTYHFTDQLKLTLGGRLFRTELDNVTTQGGALVGGPAATISGRSHETGFSPKASITWQPNADILVYALASRGFRFGGPNIGHDPNFPIPAQFVSDSLWNYEAGARTTLANGKLQLDGTLYWIDWSNIQVTLATPSGLSYTSNAGKARNRGFEASATYRPARALTLQGALTYLDGKLRRDFTVGAITAPKGSQLPGASHWQVSDSILYAPSNWPHALTLSLSHRYISSAPGELSPDAQRQGGYNLFDLRVGVTVKRLGLAVFVDNIGDARGVSEAVTGLTGPINYLVQPRTIGFTLDYKL